MASKTGSTSVGEPEMTFKMSAARGLLFERLLRLVEQPHILDGDDRLVGERLQERDLLGREGIGPRALER